uniref:Uncharacterized protein n=1 Tax=Cacopsylla melanoneura TaxID=428564 RepID=A0A8D8RRX5_9HEMI
MENSSLSRPSDVCNTPTSYLSITIQNSLQSLKPYLQTASPSLDHSSRSLELLPLQCHQTQTSQLLLRPTLIKSTEQLISLLTSIPLDTWSPLTSRYCST